MNDLLTTKQLQDLLQVDRITIYRMLNDGRLRGFKVGGQWRFSHSEIETWLQEQQVQSNGAEPSTESSSSPSPASEALPIACVQAIQGVCAEALDIGVITTDLDGNPLTKVSNSCEFCELILSTDEGRRRCSTDWKQADDGQVRTCHAGMLCSGALIEIDDRPVAITAGCQMASQVPAAGETERRKVMAAELGLDPEELERLAGTAYPIPKDSLDRVCSLLQRAASAFSEIGQERLKLLSRLQHIAEMSKVR